MSDGSRSTCGDAKANILLVDDRPENLLALQAVLEHPEYNLVQATSGPEALRCLLQEEEFAVIVLDVRMDGMDGFQTAALLRERDKTRHTPIIFLTAQVRDSAHVLEGYSLGAVDYLFKPPEPAILRAKVSVFVELFKQRQELRRQAAALTASNAELESFCYSVSHDLRAPLRHVVGYVQMLEEDCAPSLDETGRKYLNAIAKAATKMGVLIDDLLSFSRMMRAELRRARVNMNDLVKETLQELASDTQGRKIDWKIDPLPEVVGDRSMLKQVWVNLLSNAVKFTRHRDHAAVHVRCERTRDGELEFAVLDNGAGFDMKHVDKLFGVFQRLHREEEYEGTGIGLANVRRIVHRHGGKTWAEGRLNEGAALYFTLPAEPPPAPPSPLPTETEVETVRDGKGR
jgi:two-component system, sensor histidine kinase and response regulator